jgi:sporulation protein YlmC with PRC-barrel domain
MIQLSRLLGNEAFELESATNVGTVDGIVIDDHRIVVVAASGTHISRDAIRGFDGDVLTFDARLSHVDDYSVAPIDPREKRVIDVNGDALGVIDDMTISGDGIIETIVLASHEVLDGSLLLTIGSYAAVVAIA